MARPSINTRCVAQNYAGKEERIAEFYGYNGKGGLISVWNLPDGRVKVDVNRTDPGVIVLCDPKALHLEGILPYGWENQ